MRTICENIYILINRLKGNVRCELSLEATDLVGSTSEVPLMAASVCDAFACGTVTVAAKAAVEALEGSRLSKMME